LEENILCALILFMQTLALYKSFTYLILTYLTTGTLTNRPSFHNHTKATKENM